VSFGVFIFCCFVPRRSSSRRTVCNWGLGKDGALHLRPVFLADVWEPGIRHDPPIHKFHDVEGCPDHADILAETVCLGYGDVGLLKRVDDTVFALDLVCRLGEEYTGRLLAHNVLLAIGGGELVGWVGLSEAELDEEATRGGQLIEVLRYGTGIVWYGLRT
jgi:hypothetical protein